MRRTYPLLLAVVLIAAGCATEQEQRVIADRRDAEMAKVGQAQPTATGQVVNLLGQTAMSLLKK